MDKTRSVSSGHRATRPTIGYLAGRIVDDISQALWTGIVDAAQDYGANLLCFVGDPLRDAQGESSPANVIYDLISPELVDGLVSWASTVGGTLETDEIVRFHRRYRPLPLVSITLPMEDCPTVLINSYQGMRDMLTHLIEFHKYHRLAFIRGPQNHYYAQERYRAYTDALKAYDISLNPHLITAPGDFHTSTGAEGIRVLLDERKLSPGVDFDVLVTVSDLLAIGALNELHVRGIQIPDVVALVGFNDVMEGRFVTPSLTSVRLPFYEQGRKAVELLLTSMSGESVPMQTVLPAKLHVRQSCGCLLTSVVQAAAGVMTAPSISAVDATAFQCWNSIQHNYGVNACGLMSMMGNNLMPSACEVDVAGAAAMYALQLASGTPSALVDWNNNYEENPDKCVLFHCGNWPKSIYGDKIKMAYADVLATTLGKTNTYGALAGRAPSGPVSFARVSTDDVNGKIRTYVADGMMTDDPLDTFGSRAVVEVSGLQALLKHVCKNGFEHHVAMNASHSAVVLAEAFETYLGWDVYWHRG